MTSVEQRRTQLDDDRKHNDAAHTHAAVAPPAFIAPEPHYRSAASTSAAGLSAQHDALSLKALTQRFYTWFKDSGMLAALQTQFRAQIIQQIPRRHLITSGGAAAAANSDASFLSLRSTKDQTLLQRAANSLIMDYFREFDYPFALSIFGPESGSVGASNANLTTEDILAVLRLQTKSNGNGSGGAGSSNEWIAKRIRKALRDNDDHDEGGSSSKENRALARSTGRGSSSKTDRSRFPKRSLLALLLDSLAAQPPPPIALDSSCQTDPDTGAKDALSIDSKFREIDREYLGKQIEDSAMVFPQLQEKMLRFEREQAERFTIEMEVEKKRYADSEGARIRAEERARYRSDEDRLRKELRKESDAHLTRMRKETDDIIAKYQAKERELSDSNFRERQQLQENMNLLHSREVELARKRDVMERTQALAEAKIKEADRMLLARSSELDYLSNNLQTKIADEKKRVRTEWEQQVLKRDELIDSLSETLKSVESKLSRKTAELDSALKLMDDYEREMNSSSTGRKIGETRIVEMQHQLSLAQTQLADTETRRAKLEEQLLAATAKEQVCFHHVAELGALRARIQSQAEEFEQASRGAREKHAQDLEAERQQAQQALLAGHTAASNLVAQWKSSYVELAQELERRRAEEERAKQALEEESLVTRELKREVAALRAGLAKTGAGFHIAALPSAAPSAALFLPGVSDLHKRVGAYAPEFPPLSNAAATTPSISPVSQFQSTQLPPIPVAVVSPSSAAAASPAIVPASVQSAANTLDAEFFAREQALELETQALSHSVGMHAARERIDTEPERRERAKEQTVQAGTQRHMQLTSVAREYALSQVLPSSTSPVASESESTFAASAAARDQDLAREREAYLKLAAKQDSERRTKQAADALELRRKEMEWEQEKIEQDRRTAAQQQQAAADEQRTKQAEAQRAADEAARQREADAAAAAAAESARVAAAAAAEAEARRSAAASTTPSPSAASASAAASAPDAIAEDLYDAQAEEKLAAQLRADREQRERAERDREARLTRRMEERAAQARLAPLAAAPVLAPAPAAAPEDAAALQKAEADRAVRELEAEKEARRAVLREEERIRRERAEREAAEQEAQRQRQADADAAAADAAAAAAAAATTAAYSDPAAAAAAPVEEAVYDEAATAAYWATQGYWDETTGGWIAYTEEQKTQMREYAEYEAAQQQLQQQQAYATDATQQQQPYDQAYTAAAPALPADQYDDAISEASAEISAPQSEAEF